MELWSSGRSRLSYIIIPGQKKKLGSAQDEYNQA